MPLPMFDADYKIYYVRIEEGWLAFSRIKRNALFIYIYNCNVNAALIYTLTYTAETPAKWTILVKIMRSTTN